MRPLRRSILAIFFSFCFGLIVVAAPSAAARQSTSILLSAKPETSFDRESPGKMALPQLPEPSHAAFDLPTSNQQAYAANSKLSSVPLVLNDSPQYYYAARIVDTQRIGYTESPLHQFGVIRWTTPENILGPQDNMDAELLNSTHTDQACIIVSFGGTLTLSNGDVQAYVHQPQGITTDMGMEIDAADDLLSCNSSGWTQVYSYHEDGGPQSGGPGWYGTTYTGKVRALRILVSSAGGNGLNGDRYFYIDSIRLYATSFVPDSLAFDQALSPNECPFCGSTELNRFVGGPVNTNSGNYNYQATDLAVSALGQPLQFERSYNSLVSNIVTNTASYSLPLGYGWTHNYDTKLIFPGDPGGESGTVILKAPHGSRMRFSDGTYAPLPGVLATMTRSAVAANTYVYTVTARNLETFVFTNTGQLISHLDPLGHKTTFVYTGTLLARVSDPTGLRYLSFGYEPNGRLVSVSDQTSRSTRYNYDPNGNLASVIDTRSLTWTYQYSGTTHLLARVIDPDGRTVERTDYDGQGRAIRQYRVNNGIDELALQINYGPNGTVTVTDGLGNQTVDFYSNGIWIASTDASLHTTTRFYNKDLQPAFVVDQNGNGRWTLWGPQGNTPASVVYAPGISITNKFDALGNVTRTIDARGFATVFTCTGSFLTRKTDALTNTWIYTSTGDGRNLLAAELAPGSRLTEYHYNQFGQRDVMTVALTNVTRYGYDSIGRLISTTVYAGQPAYERTTLNRYDGAGNLISTTVNFNPDANVDPRLYNLTTLYDYDGAGRQIAITDTIGRIARNYYNEAGQLISTTANFTDTPTFDPNLYNLTTHYGYDAVGNRVLVTDTRDLVTKTEFDNLNRPVTVTQNYSLSMTTSDYNLVTITHYDPAGNVIERIEPSANGVLDRVTRTWYDNLNRPITVTRNFDPLLPPNHNNESNLTSVTTYDAAGNAVKSLDPLNHPAWFRYDELNRLISTTNALSGTTLTKYDAVGNRTLVTDVLTRATRYEYDKLNRLITTTFPYTGWVVNTYDPAGNLTRVTDALGHGTVYTYNLRGQLIAQTDAMSGTTRYEYDRIGNRVAITDAKGVVTHYDFDIAGHMLVITQSYTTTLGLDPDAYNLVTRYRYDKAGNVISTTSPLTATTVYTHDALSRVIAQSDGLGRTWNYQYDALGNRAVITDANRLVTHFEFDKANHLTAVFYPTDTVRYSYDGIGNRTVMTDAIGVTTFRYDALNRLMGHTDPLRKIITNTYDAYGNVIGLRYPDGKVVTYAYNANNWLTGVQDWNGRVITYTYDRVGRVITQELPNQVVTAYRYDDANRLTGLTTRNASWTLGAYTYTLDALGQVITSTEYLGNLTFLDYLPLITNNYSNTVGGQGMAPQGGTTFISPLPLPEDGLGAFNSPLPTPQPTTPNVQTLLQSSASVNNFPNALPTTFQSPIGGPSGSCPGGLPTFGSVVSIAYTYDPLSRLTDAFYSSGACFRYNYDAGGNVTWSEETITSTRIVTYAYDVTSRLQTSKVDVEATIWYYRFDNNGNLVEMTPNGTSPAGGAIRYTYNGTNQLNKIETHSGSAYVALAQIAYDGIGSRVVLTGWVSGVAYTTTYASRIAGKVQILHATSGTNTTSYLYGLNQIGEFGTQSIYYLTDGAGSIRHLVDSNGAVKLARLYEPFGQVLMQAGIGDPFYGYLGAQFDRISGLLYINGRYYDPVTGRFLSPSDNGQNPYIPLGGAALTPILILALIGHRKKGKIWTGWIVLAMMMSVGLTLVACGTGPNTPTSTRKPYTPPPTNPTLNIYTPTPVAIPPASPATPTAAPLPPTPPQCPTPATTFTPVATPADMDIIAVAQVASLEPGGLGIWETQNNKDEVFVALAWVIRNRINASGFGCSTAQECAYAPSQFYALDRSYEPTQHELDLARSVLTAPVEQDPTRSSVWFHDFTANPGPVWQRRIPNPTGAWGFYLYTREQCPGGPRSNDVGCSFVPTPTPASNP